MVSTGINQMCRRMNGGRIPSEGTVTDNHGANVTAFSVLLCENEAYKCHLFTFQKRTSKLMLGTILCI